MLREAAADVDSLTVARREHDPDRAVGVGQEGGTDLAGVRVERQQPRASQRGLAVVVARGGEGATKHHRVADLDHGVDLAVEHVRRPGGGDLLHQLTSRLVRRTDPWRHRQQQRQYGPMRITMDLRGLRTTAPAWVSEDLGDLSGPTLGRRARANIPYIGEGIVRLGLCTVLVPRNAWPLAALVIGLPLWWVLGLAGAGADRASRADGRSAAAPPDDPPPGGLRLVAAFPRSGSCSGVALLWVDAPGADARRRQRPPDGLRVPARLVRRRARSSCCGWPTSTGSPYRTARCTCWWPACS